MDMAVNLERYLSAGNSRDLTAKAGRHDDIDALVGVAWNRSRVGASLLRLHSDWDGSAKRGMKLEQSFLALKEMPHVLGALFLWAMEGAAQPPRREQIQDAQELSREVVIWWLDRICKTCKGTKWVTRAHKPMTPCTTCHGTGEAPIPQGQRGRAMVSYMESCLYRARASIKGRMRR
jgi:hypothetical protein